MESLNKLLKVVNNFEVNGISEDVVNTAFDAVHKDGLISGIIIFIYYWIILFSYSKFVS